LVYVFGKNRKDYETGSLETRGFYPRKFWILKQTPLNTPHKKKRSIQISVQPSISVIQPLKFHGTHCWFYLKNKKQHRLPFTYSALWQRWFQLPPLHCGRKRGEPRSIF